MTALLCSGRRLLRPLDGERSSVAGRHGSTELAEVGSTELAEVGATELAEVGSTELAEVRGRPLPESPMQRRHRKLLERGPFVNRARRIVPAAARFCDRAVEEKTAILLSVVGSVLS